MKLIACVIGMAALGYAYGSGLGLPVDGPQVREAMGAVLVVGLLGLAIWTFCSIARWLFRTVSWTLLLVLTLLALMPSLTGVTPTWPPGFGL